MHNRQDPGLAGKPEQIEPFFLMRVTLVFLQQSVLIFKDGCRLQKADSMLA